MISSTVVMNVLCVCVRARACLPAHNCVPPWSATRTVWRGVGRSETLCLRACIWTADDYFYLPPSFIQDRRIIETNICVFVALLIFGIFTLFSVLNFCLFRVGADGWLVSLSLRHCHGDS